MKDAIESKFKSQPLRDAVSLDRPDCLSVLVELAVPMPQIDFGPRSKTGRLTPRGVEPPLIEETQACRTRMAALLEEVLGKVPRYSTSAAAFFIEGTGTQLKKIAESPDVKAIHPNRNIV